MAVIVNDLYTILHEVTGLTFQQQTRIKLHYQPVSTIWSIKWKLIKTPFSIGNPAREYVFESGLDISEQQTDYITLDMSGSYKIEVEEVVDGITNYFVIAIQANALKDDTTAPFPEETTEIDTDDGFLRKIEQTIQHLSENEGNRSLIGVYDSHQSPLNLGETVVTKETSFIDDINPAGHVWEIETAFESTQSNALVGIIIGKYTKLQYDGNPSKVYYHVAYLGQYNVEVSMPMPLSSLGSTGGNFYFITDSKTVTDNFAPNHKYWGKYITEDPSINNSGYNVISLENMIYLNYPEDLFNSTFSLEFDRHDGIGDVRWAPDDIYPNVTVWEIEFLHELDSNNLVVEVWKEPNDQSVDDWRRVDIDEIVKNDRNNMTLRITELDPNPSNELDTCDFKGRINIINLQEVSNTSPNGLFWATDFDGSTSPTFTYSSWYLFTDDGINYRRRNFKHNFNTSNIFIQLWDKTEPEEERLLVDKIRQINDNEVMIQVPDGEEFPGKILIASNLVGNAKSFLSLLDTPDTFGTPGQIPKIDSTATSLIWGDGAGLWTYDTYNSELSVTPADSLVKWCQSLNFVGELGIFNEVHATNVQVNTITFNSTPIPSTSTLSVINQPRNHNLRWKLPSGNYYNVTTWRERVTDLTVSEDITHNHWATTQAIVNYVSGLSGGSTLPVVAEFDMSDDENISFQISTNMDIILANSSINRVPNPTPFREVVLPNINMCHEGESFIISNLRIVCTDTRMRTYWPLRIKTNGPETICLLALHGSFTEDSETGESSWTYSTNLDDFVTDAIYIRSSSSVTITKGSQFIYFDDATGEYVTKWTWIITSSSATPYASFNMSGPAYGGYG